jgi:hypothetical protein
MATFNHVQVLRGSSAEIPAVYPPADGVVAIEGGYATDPAKTEGLDPTAEAGSAWYRAVAFDANDKAIAASAVKGVTTLGVGELGAFGISDGDPGTGDLMFAWSPFAGAADCFTFYKLVASIDDPTPSYLEGAMTVAAISDQGAEETTASLDSSQTYYFRVQVIRATSLGKFVVAQSAVIPHQAP